MPPAHPPGPKPPRPPRPPRPPQVLIVEDSPSTAHLARLALTDLPCEVAVAGGPSHALELVRGSRKPRVLVVDTYLPGVSARQFVIHLWSEAPSASLVLLVDRGVFAPPVPAVEVRKPLQPRRFAALIEELIAGDDCPPDRPVEPAHD